MQKHIRKAAKIFIRVFLVCKPDFIAWRKAIKQRHAVRQLYSAVIVRRFDPCAKHATASAHYCADYLCAQLGVLQVRLLELVILQQLGYNRRESGYPSNLAWVMPRYVPDNLRCIDALQGCAVIGVHSVSSASNACCLADIVTLRPTPNVKPNPHDYPLVIVVISMRYKPRVYMLKCKPDASMMGVLARYYRADDAFPVNILPVRCKRFCLGKCAAINAAALRPLQPCVIRAVACILVYPPAAVKD